MPAVITAHAQAQKLLGLDGKVVKLSDDLLSATRYAMMMLRFAEQIYRRDKPRRRRGFFWGGVHDTGAWMGS